MNLTYRKAEPWDVEPVFELCKGLIQDYERLESIDYPKVIKWVRRKIEASIHDYTVIYDDELVNCVYLFYNADNFYIITVLVARESNLVPTLYLG